MANLEETLSINHNWFHAPVLPSITAFLLEEWRAVKEAIADTRNEELEVSDSLLSCLLGPEGHADMLQFDAEWEGQCQLVMGADCGMNIVEVSGVRFLPGQGIAVTCAMLVLLVANGKAERTSRGFHHDEV